MGHYRIIIEGTGCHHNKPENAFDANKLAQDLTNYLKRGGHHIVRATMEVRGNHQEMLPQGVLMEDFLVTPTGVDKIVASAGAPISAQPMGANGDYVR